MPPRADAAFAMLYASADDYTIREAAAEYTYGLLLLMPPPLLLIAADAASHATGTPA